MNAVSHDRKNPNVTSNDSLVVRLEINAKYASFDFHQWVLGHLAIGEGMDVLDVGSGNGAQSVVAAKTVGPKGSVSALDLSAKSVEELCERGKGFPNLDARVGDMKDLGQIIARDFRVKTYDLVHSVYALWYASDHIGVLEAMRQSLKPGGRLAVCTPNYPNGLRELAKRVGRPLPHLDQINNFGSNVLEPYFRTFFYQVTIHLRKNVLCIPTAEEVMNFYRATAYFASDLEPVIRRHVDLEIEMNGYFKFEKNNYLVVGEIPISS